MSRSRNYVFTVNYPEPGEEIGFDDKYMKFLVYQKEKGEQGNPHFQGYVVFKTSVTLATAKKRIHKKAHLEVRKGTHEQAKEYCIKGDTRLDGPWMYGVEPAQGKRNDLVAVKKCLDDGGKLSDVAEEHFGVFMRYHKGLSLYMSLKQKKRDFISYTKVFFGPPGSGKTRRAVQECIERGRSYYMLSPPNQSSGAVWWDGYAGQDAVIIDDFYGWITHQFMLRLCDRYPMQVQTKGGVANFLSKYIYITSNKFPSEWWPRTGYGAMARRTSGNFGEIRGFPLAYCWTPEGVDLTFPATPEGIAIDPVPQPQELSGPPLLFNLCRECKEAPIEMEQQVCSRCASQLAPVGSSM